jgi:hypothetical protein
MNEKYLIQVVGFISFQKIMIYYINYDTLYKL